jgi:putative NADPH-quinone reductase
MTNIVIINGHPDPDPGRFCKAIADTYAKSSENAGHQIKRIEVAQLDFPLLRTQEDFEHGNVAQDIEYAQQAINNASHIVIIYPLWLGTMPALLKAFFEQVFRPGFAFKYVDKGLPEKLLTGRSVRIIITMGMPSMAYKWFFLAHSLRSLERNILKFAGLGPVRSTLFGGVETASDEKRKQWLDDIAALARQAS